MARINIDGKVCEFEGKKTILEVALDNGIEIPHYCYHPGLSVVASCRICLVDVAQPNPRNENKLELIPKLNPACKTPAVDGSEVYTQSPRSVANQKAVMEYLLINHPLDCPVCDQAGECYLQDYSYKFGRSESRFVELKIKQPKKDLGPHVLLYSDRCIMCTRCVRFTQEVSGTSEIGVFGRGSDEQIDIFPGKALENELSGNVVDICPVGALLDKDFLMSMRVWNLSKTPGIDGLTAGGDNISIEWNEDRVYRVKPRINMDLNKWWISDEIRFGWKFIHSTDRLTGCWHKKQGSLEPCDWSEALSLSVDKLRQAAEGGGRLALMVSPMLTSEEAWLLGRMIRDLDSQAIVGIGPVPVQGEDKHFPGGYTVRAEKCPNQRGVTRALRLLDIEPLAYGDFVKAIAQEPVKAVVLTANYPSRWWTHDLQQALEGRFTLLIDTLTSDLAQSMDIVLPGAVWMEKVGCFENVDHRIQSFPQAITAPQFARPEGQIALDLSAAMGSIHPTRYEADAIRTQMGGAFAQEVHHPVETRQELLDMEYQSL